MDRKKKVCFARIKGTVFALGLALLILGAGIAPGNGHAQGKVKPEVRLPKGYPDGFDGFGYLDEIASGRAVINDHELPVALDVKYYTPTEQYAAERAFVPGKLVGYLLNPQGRITSLWLIE